MNPGAIPIIMSVAICIVCGSAAVVGGLLLIDEQSRPRGRQVLRCSMLSLVTGVFFAWAGLLPCGLLWHFDDRVAVLAFWASGPLGVVFGVAWHSLGLPIASRSHRRSSAKPESESNDK